MTLLFFSIIKGGIAFAVSGLFPESCPVQGFICLNNTVYTKGTSELKYLKPNNAKIFGYTLKDDLKQLRILRYQNFNFQADIFFEI